MVPHFSKVTKDFISEFEVMEDGDRRRRTLRPLIAKLAFFIIMTFFFFFPFEMGSHHVALAGL
jgi:hypothetical protein